MSLTKKEKEEIKEVLTREALMDTVFHKNGLITAKKKFIALKGRTSKMYAEKIEQLIPSATITEHKTSGDLFIVKFELKGANQ